MVMFVCFPCLKFLKRAVSCILGLRVLLLGCGWATPALPHRLRAPTCHFRDSQPSVTAAAIVLRSGFAAVRPWNLDIRDCNSWTCNTNSKALERSCCVDGCPS